MHLLGGLAKQQVLGSQAGSELHEGINDIAVPLALEPQAMLPLSSQFAEMPACPFDLISPFKQTSFAEYGHAARLLSIAARPRPVDLSIDIAHEAPKTRGMKVGCQFAIGLGSLSFDRAKARSCPTAIASPACVFEQDILIAGFPETRVQPVSMAPYPAPITLREDRRKEQQGCVETRKLDTHLVDCVGVTSHGSGSAVLDGMDTSLYNAPERRSAIDVAGAGTQVSPLIFEGCIPFHRTKS
nr:hypothetical protein [Bradyrhizobium japonicum]